MAASHAEGEQPVQPAGIAADARVSDHGQPIAGSGEQPSLPETPAHWQQTSFVPAAQPDLARTAAEDAPQEIERPVDTPSQDSAAAEPAVAETGDTATPRRRTRRDDGERAPRTRKPRRSREETAAEAPAPVAAESVSETTPEPVATPEPVKMPAAAEQPLPAPAVSHESAFAPLAAAETTSASITVIEIPSSGDPAVTVLDKPSDHDGEPKRRGWWRRLME